MSWEENLLLRAGQIGMEYIMNPQFKKGVLELIVLESVRQKDMYGYELVEEVSEVDRKSVV